MNTFYNNTNNITGTSQQSCSFAAPEFNHILKGTTQARPERKVQTVNSKRGFGLGSTNGALNIIE